MKFIRARDFKPARAWASLPIANMKGVTTKLHWTDRPYEWHVNDGEEVFVVLDGAVEMHFKENGLTKRRRMEPGDIFHASLGTEHVAHPVGEARILVVESEGSR